jgi:hypothetical protein
MLSEHLVSAMVNGRWHRSMLEAKSKNAISTFFSITFVFEKRLFWPFATVSISPDPNDSSTSRFASPDGTPAAVAGLNDAAEEAGAGSAQLVRVAHRGSGKGAAHDGGDVWRPVGHGVGDFRFDALAH